MLFFLNISFYKFCVIFPDMRMGFSRIRLLQTVLFIVALLAGEDDYKLSRISLNL